ncbi:MAG: acetoacetate--CoA ligase [Pseudomonadales bacterium]|jgi:acetoacetyl-CoA synthetase|nr:acetoacetate--CoA ligase [Pseudomonadales bacterium]
MASVGEILWQPSQEWIDNSNLQRFRLWLKQHRGREFSDLHALYRWSVNELEEFWSALWDFFQIQASAPPSQTLATRTMPGAEWFPGARLNYAEHILRHERHGATALLYCSERLPLQAMDWRELGNSVRKLATHLRALGIKPGDRVAAYLPNIPEAVIALLATSSIGAIWSSCSPDFGTHSVLDRLSQISPKALFCVDGYYYKGQRFERKQELRHIISALDSLETVVYLPYMDQDDLTPPTPGALLWNDLLQGPDISAKNFHFEQVSFSHPLWILFSSGTTGLPKAIVHGHGGITLEQHKLSVLHYDLKPGDRVFFYTTTGWMMWNFVVSSMLAQACPILYDGNPVWPEPDALWRMADQAGACLFGASPSLQQMQEKAGVVPKNKYQFERLRCIMLAGSPVSAECTEWFYNNVKADLFLGPGSGGTDICSGFCGPMPGLPVKAGVIQMPHLGVDLQAFDEAGHSIRNAVGEFVVCQPMPSMPLYFWNDADNKRYRETYFADYPGVWRQGDYFMIDGEDGCFVLGRSDATLNRYGVRIGTAEIYRSLAGLPAVEDAIIVNLELPGGKFYMPLFVKLQPHILLDDALKQAINQRLRSDYSPRHVPDEIHQVEDIPYTLTGKKMEVPLRKILLGAPVTQAANRDAMSNPRALEWFVRFRETQRVYSLESA